MKTTINLRIDDFEKSHLDRLSKEREISVSSLVRELIFDYLDQLDVYTFDVLDSDLEPIRIDLTKINWDEC